MIFWTKVVVPALNVIGLVGSLAGIVVAAALLLDSRATFGVFRALNRWVSTRQAIKPLELPRSMERDMGSALRWYAIAFVIGGAYSAFALLQITGPATLTAFGIRPTLVAAIVVDTARWVLIAGGIAAAVLGLLALFSPGSWHALESRANRWYSTRRALAGGDALRMTLDGLVERNPRGSAIVIGTASVLAAAAYAYLLLK